MKRLSVDGLHPTRDAFVMKCLETGEQFVIEGSDFGEMARRAGYERTNKNISHYPLAKLDGDKRSQPPRRANWGLR